MSKPLENRIALVTGASRGIGRAVALELARQGAHVVALARTQGALEELDDEIQALGGEATLAPCDLKDFDALDRLGLALFERWRKLDIHPLKRQCHTRRQQYLRRRHHDQRGHAGNYYHRSSRWRQLRAKHHQQRHLDLQRHERPNPLRHHFWHERRRTNHLK
jgi:hypothetical protein